MRARDVRSARSPHVSSRGRLYRIRASLVRCARCALAWSVETATLAREHNDAQLIGIGGRMHTLPEALAIVDAFLGTPFSGEERHQRRIDILSEYERSGDAPDVPGGQKFDGSSTPA